MRFVFFDSMKPNRQSIRLKGYDYSAEGAYFVTIVCKNRLPWFGEITNGEMKLSEAGKIIKEEWLRGAELRSEITLDVYVVMPNHFHGIVVIGDPTIPMTGIRRGVWTYARDESTKFQSPKKSIGFAGPGIQGRLCGTYPPNHFCRFCLAAQFP